jgi:haloalkane dehalogenase
MTTERELTDDEKFGYLFPYRTPATRVAVSRFVQDIPMEQSHPTRAVLKRVEEQLPLLNCPKLILWGAKDFCFHTGFFQQWKDIYPQAKSVLYPDAGHYVIEDKQAECIQQIEHFLQ